jgi:polyhydroxybutyrate depolymerase
MKKLTFLLFAVLFTLSANAQYTRTYTWNGAERIYDEFIPADTAVAKPVVLFLHGIGGTKEQVTDILNATSPRPDWFYIIPQALDFSAIGITLSAWNAGLTATIFGYPIPLQPDVDDVGFFMAVLDSLSKHYKIDADSIFVAGFSLGGYMTNRMAIEHSDKINAVASVSGTIGNNIQNQMPVANLNTLHIHGTTDEIVHYDGTVSLSILDAGQVGLSAEATVDFWRNFNNCNVTPVEYNYPDTQNDNLTFERKYYLNGAGGSRTAFVKVNGGFHNWYSLPQNDIDYFQEIAKFFRNEWATTPNSVDFVETVNFKIYPNPVKSELQINLLNFQNLTGLNVEISDLTGRTVGAYCIRPNETAQNKGVSITPLQNGTQSINVSHLLSGVYFIKIQTDKGAVTQKFIKE